jgi:two-component system, NtrC family, sensor kinase
MFDYWTNCANAPLNGRSVEELRALGEVSRAVNSTLDLETVLLTIVAQAVQLSGTEAGAIYVFDDRQRELRLRATYGMDQELIEALTQRRIGFDDPNVVQALAQSEPIQAADLRDETPNEINEITLRAGFRARLTAPLTRGEDVVGFLVVRRRAPGAFPQNTVDLIKTFAAQSAVAIENARLFKNVETSLEDLRTTQDRLVQTQKLASLGQLTAGIAHEIKNPLNFVNNFSGVSAELMDELREALDRMTGDDKTRAEIAELSNTLRDNLSKIAQHGKRADSIVKNMLLHSREGSGEHRLVDAKRPRRGKPQSRLSWSPRRESELPDQYRAVFGPGCRSSRRIPAGDHTGSPEPDLQRLLCGDQAQRAKR